MSPVFDRSRRGYLMDFDPPGFKLGQFVGEGTSSGEGLLLRAAADGTPRVVARFQPA